MSAKQQTVSALSPLARAKVVNALRSLPVGYAFHSDEPIMRCMNWAEGFDPALHDAAVEVISSIGAYHPDMIGGSGWLDEANKRMKLIAGVEALGGRGKAGMDASALAASVGADKQARAAEVKKAAKAQREAQAQATASAAAGLAAAFAPAAGGDGASASIDAAFAPPAGVSGAAGAPDVGGSGVVKEEEEEDLSGGV